MKMPFIQFLQDFYLATKIPRKVGERRAKIFNFNIKGEEELSLPVWEYLVKARAGFECEDCKSATGLQSHHIKAIRNGGQNTLKNGKCVCIACHNKYKNHINLRGRLHLNLCRTYGSEKGTNLFEELRKLKTLKEREAMLDSLLKDILPDKKS